MTDDEKKEIEKIVANAEKEATFLRLKSLWEIHQKFKAEHPRPKHKKGKAVKSDEN